MSPVGRISFECMSALVLGEESVYGSILLRHSIGFELITYRGLGGSELTIQDTGSRSRAIGG